MRFFIASMSSPRAIFTAFYTICCDPSCAAGKMGNSAEYISFTRYEDLHGRSFRRHFDYSFDRVILERRCPRTSVAHWDTDEHSFAQLVPYKSKPFPYSRPFTIDAFTDPFNTSTAALQSIAMDLNSGK